MISENKHISTEALNAFEELGDEGRFKVIEAWFRNREKDKKKNNINYCNTCDLNKICHPNLQEVMSYQGNCDQWRNNRI